MTQRALWLAGLLAAAGCAEDSGTTDQGTWTVDHMEDGGALFSVWGSSADDVWASGGQAGNGLILHNDGSGWTRVVTGARELLIWTYGFHAEDVYAVGEGGLILHYDGASWQEVDSGTDVSLYGVWGTSSDDVWIVGGEPNGDAGSAVILRGSGRSFSPVENIPADVLPGALYKAYGGPQDSVMMVGEGGAVVRFDGESWYRDSTPTSHPLFSMWGRADDDIYAVGGYGVNEVLHFDGHSWTRVSDPDSFGIGLSGVFTAPGFSTVAVGFDSYVLEIAPDGSQYEPAMPLVDPIPALHGVWGDEHGTTYAVGGNIYDYPNPMSGTILRRSAD